MEIQHNVKLLFVFIVVVVGWVFFGRINCCNGTAVIDGIAVVVLQALLNLS